LKTWRQFAKKQNAAKVHEKEMRIPVSLNLIRMIMIILMKKSIARPHSKL